jgi:hypothetical protein
MGGTIMPIHIIATGVAAGHRVTRVRQRTVSPIAALVRAIVKNMFDPYRPELHYMRGPGPKWRERHAQRRR